MSQLYSFRIRLRQLANNPWTSGLRYVTSLCSSLLVYLLLNDFITSSWSTNTFDDKTLFQDSDGLRTLAGNFHFVRRAVSGMGVSLALFALVIEGDFVLRLMAFPKADTFHWSQFQERWVLVSLVLCFALVTDDSSIPDSRKSIKNLISEIGLRWVFFFHLSLFFVLVADDYATPGLWRPANSAQTSTSRTRYLGNRWVISLQVFDGQGVHLQKWSESISTL